MYNPKMNFTVPYAVVCLVIDMEVFTDLVMRMSNLRLTAGESGQLSLSVLLPTLLTKSN